MDYVITALLCLLVGYLIGRYVIGPRLQVLAVLTWSAIMCCLPWIASRVQVLVALLVTLTFWVGYLLGWLTRGVRQVGGDWPRVLCATCGRDVAFRSCLRFGDLCLCDHGCLPDLRIVSPPKPR